MSAGASGRIDKAALEKLIANSGVKLTSEELDTLIRSLARIEAAATTLAQFLPFDETSERFYRLLEADAVGGAGG